jgi:hypothetical protein
MTKVFIGGSRRISRLNADVRKRLDRIIEKGFPVLIGDANGADKAVQRYLQSRRYERVEVFCSEGVCRNNAGNWPVRAVPAREGKRGFNFYATKDRVMADEATVGFMIWDGKSVGTLANVFRLVNQHKKVVLYTVPRKQFSNLADEGDWRALVTCCRDAVRHRVEQYVAIEERATGSSVGASLF